MLPMNYLINHPEIVWNLTLQHLQMTGLGLLIGVILVIPSMLLMRRFVWLNLVITGLLSVLYTIPSLALMILLLPWLGLNATTVIVAIALYAQVILIRSLNVGLDTIPHEILEAADGMGMSDWQRWWWVQFPLILPVFIAGLRLAAIVGIAIATLGAKFGAGGLGVLLFEGIAQAGRSDKIGLGAIAVAILSLFVNMGLLAVESFSRRLPQRHL
jgi:osmoprotectant transport system permease protein